MSAPPPLNITQVKVGPVGGTLLADNVDVALGDNAFEIRSSDNTLPPPADAIVKFYGYAEGGRHGESEGSVTFNATGNTPAVLKGKFKYKPDGAKPISQHAILSAHIRRRGGVDFDERAVEATLPASTISTWEPLIFLVRKCLRWLYPKW